MASANESNLTVTQRITNMGRSLISAFMELCQLDDIEQQQTQEPSPEPGPDDGDEWIAVSSKHKRRTAPKQVALPPEVRQLEAQLTWHSPVGDLPQHEASRDQLLTATFRAPDDFGLDCFASQGSSLPSYWELSDFVGKQSTLPPTEYNLLQGDESSSNFWTAADIMVSEVNYVALFKWLKGNSSLWTEDVNTVYVYVDNRNLCKAEECPPYWPLFCPWLKARCSYLGPFHEITSALYVPIFC